jgi:hypothetical protein
MSRNKCNYFFEQYHFFKRRKKQNVLTFVDSLVLNSIVVKPAVSKLIYTPAISGEIKATTLTIEDPFTEESINVKDTLDSKQNILIPG